MTPKSLIPATVFCLGFFVVFTLESSLSAGIAMGGIGFLVGLFLFSDDPPTVQDWENKQL